MNIDQLLEAADKASPGPWHVSGEGIYRENGLCSIARIGNAMSAVAGTEEANATIIAGAPQLAAEVRRLRERERVLVEALGYVVCCDVNQMTSSISPITRLRLAANRARAVLEAVKE